MPDTPRSNPCNTHVTLLLALYNGAAHLQEQLDSFSAQTHPDWSLIVSDDGSRDAGPDMVHRFAHGHPGRDISLVQGPRMGFARNFLHLLQQAGPHTPHVALSDQDDVWMPDKLAAGVAALACVPADQPALYCSRTMICDTDLEPRQPSPLFRRPPGFRNALVQNMAAGNTIMLNRAALDLLQAAARKNRRLVAHDWWIYLIITGAGGQVIYDTEPRLYYRQHAANQIGANDTLRASLQRIRQLLDGRFSTWNRVNIITLSDAADLLTPQNRALLEDFRALRRHPLPRRLRALHRLGLYRQSRQANAALWLAALIGRL